MLTTMLTLPSPKRSDGFTLIELLTVIAIIGVLAAILIPVAGRVRDAARDARCQSNLRQIGMAVLGFAADNRGLVPLADGPIAEQMVGYRPTGVTNSVLTNMIESYLSSGPRTVATGGDTPSRQSVLLCPSGANTDMTGIVAPVFEGYGFRTNELAPDLASPTPITQRVRTMAGAERNFLNLNRLPHPTRTILGGDWRAHTMGISGATNAVNRTADSRHSGSLNFVRFDASVVKLRKEAVLATMETSHPEFNMTWRGY
jgi:prepilin-type N-terminal cleavage/methylation domain-containing protein